MRVVFMGTPEFAVPSLEALHSAGHEVVTVCTQPDAVSGRGKKIRFSPVKDKAIELGIPVLQPEKIKGNEEFLKQLSDCKPDVIVVAAYGKILPKTVLNLPPMGCINVHASLLPRFRGAAPIQKAIIEGDETTGVTIMQMGEGLDTGDMIARIEIPVDNMTGQQLHDVLASSGAELLVRVLPEISNIEPEKQDDSLSTYAPMISKADGHADFSAGPERLERMIRAFDPWPGTFADLNGKQIKFWHASVPGIDTDAADGTIIDVSSSGIDIASSGRVIRVDTIQMPGKKRVAVAEYLKGNSIEIGTVLI